MDPDRRRDQDDLPPPESGLPLAGDPPLKPTYDPQRWAEKEETVPLDLEVSYKTKIETVLYALRHFELRIVPECDEIEDWDNLDRRSQRLYRAAVLKELLQFSDWGYRELEDVLADGGAVARKVGFSANDGTDHSTLATGTKALEIDETFLERAAEHSYNAALHAVLPGGSFALLGSYPSKPRSYYEIVDEEWGVDMETRMDQASKIVAKYMALVTPHLELHRDKSAANFKYPVEEIYRLLAHIALEKSAAKNGSEILEWLSDDDVPSDSTLHEYIAPTGEDSPSYEVEEIEAMFIDATCELLERGPLAPTDPVHLAYDVTVAPWYGDDHNWVTGTLPEDNANEFWHYAVLSTVSPGRNYILGATPIKERSEKGEALDRMLRQVRSTLDLDLGRIYLDRQLYQGDVVTKCRQHGLNWLIQAPNKGEAKRLTKKTPLSQAQSSEKGVEFSDFDYSHQQVNVFAHRIHEEEVRGNERITTPATELTRYVGSQSSSQKELPDDQSRLEEHGVKTPEPAEDLDDGDLGDESAPGVGNPNTHTAWITDLDVDSRDLRGLAYQFQNRWKIETSIRQLKHTFSGQCRSSRREVRTLHFGAAQLFFNFWVALKHELPYHLDDPAGFRITGLKTLHAIREADFEEAKTGNNNII